MMWKCVHIMQKSYSKTGLIYWHFELLMWPWSWTQQSNLFTRYCQKTKSGSKRITGSQDTAYFEYMSPYSWLDLCQQQNHFKTAKHFFFLFSPFTLCLLMMHHHTKFGYKRMQNMEDMLFQTKPRHSNSNIHTPPNFIKGAWIYANSWPFLIHTHNTDLLSIYNIGCTILLIFFIDFFSVRTWESGESLLLLFCCSN